MMVSLLVAVIGALLVLAGGRDSLDNDFVLGIGTTLVSLGLVTLLSEFFLRSVYTYDLVQLVELRDHVLEVGFEEASLEANIDWAQHYKETSDVTLVLPDPSGWLSREWSILLDIAKRRALRLHIYLPDADSDDIIEFGSRMLDLTTDEYKTSLLSAEKRIRVNWENTTKSPQSQISVYRLTDPAAYSLAVAGSKSAFILHALGQHPTTNNLTFRFESDTSSAVRIWIADMVGQLRAKQYDLYFESKPTPKLKDHSNQEIARETA